MTVTATCGCGAPVVAKDKCRPCYDRWRNATNPYKKRRRPPTAMDLWLRRAMASRRRAP